MGTFTGFSEDDIRQLQAPADKHNDSTNVKDMVSKKNVLPPGPSNKKVTFKNTPKTVVANDSKNKKILTTKISNNKLNVLPEEAKLHQPDVPKEKAVLEEEGTKVDAKNDVIVVEKKLIDLKEFEIRQKQIEEQNRRRKELLSKALAARTKQTQEEAKKLEEIQNEFKKLDANLSGDVKILRQQIDAASMEYMEVQKRYVKIEKEFLDVKFLLHQKMERKEMLTEHLCTIIEKNEERKAVKLTELLNKLQFDENKVVESKENSSQAINVTNAPNS